MKQRVISAIVIVICTVVSIYFGGLVLDITIGLIAYQAAREILNIVQDKKAFLFPFIFLELLIFSFFAGNNGSCFALILFLITICTILVFDKDVNFKDMSAIFLLTTYVGLGLKYIRYFGSISKWLLGYIFVVTYITDTFALFVGMLLGKHKLNERISPKKTIEGFIGGYLFGAVLSFAWANFFDFFGLSFEFCLISSLILPIVSQIGDLIFSMFKRHFGIKDFSDLIPGHGGILDRLDSSLTSALVLGAISILFI